MKKDNDDLGHVFDKGLKIVRLYVRPARKKTTGYTTKQFSY